MEIRLDLGSSLISRFHIQYDSRWFAIVSIENESTARKMKSSYCSACATARVDHAAPLVWMLRGSMYTFRMDQGVEGLLGGEE